MRQTNKSVKLVIWQASKAGIDQNTVASFNPVFCNLAANTKVVPAKINTPENIFIPTYDPLERCRIAPAMGFVVNPPIDPNKNTRPVRYPITLKFGVIFTIKFAINEAYAPEVNPKMTANRITAQLLEAGIHKPSTRIPDI